MPEVGRENIKESRRRQDDGRQFRLRLYVMLGEIGITGDAVVHQVGNVSAIKSFVVAQPGETGRGIDAQKNPEGRDEDEPKQDRPRQRAPGHGVLLSRHFWLSCSCNALNSGWLESSSTACAASVLASSRLPENSSAFA